MAHVWLSFSLILMQRFKNIYYLKTENYRLTCKISGYVELGEIQNMWNGVLIMDNLRYIQVINDDMLLECFNNGKLYELYDACFSAPPYCEDFAIAEVCEKFKKYLVDGLLWLCFDGKKVVGFVAATPAVLSKKANAVVKKYLTDVAEYWYIDDIGSHPQYRKKGIATTLLRTLLDNVPVLRIILATHENNEDSKNLYLKFGFKLLVLSDGSPVIQKVLRSQKSGRIDYYNCIFMTYDK